MHFDLNELFYEIIRKSFEYKGIELDDEEIEEIQLQLSRDKEFSEYVKNCIRFDGIAIDRCE